MSKQISPLPWAFDKYGAVKVGNETVVVDGFALSCGPSNPEAKANAYFIVKAVNSHDAMKSALLAARELARLVANSAVVAPATAADASRTLGAIDRALAAAGEGHE